MKYCHIEEGEFLERPNRFIAYVNVSGRRETVHVKNTGRCRELLIPGAKVYLEKSENPARKTLYDLVAVQKGELLINMDSQAPNRAAQEWLLGKKLFPDLKKLRPETVYRNSRFDFYLETEEKKIFLEVKGVTLEENGVVLFPDAPSERAVKHVDELIAAKEDGFEVYVLFVVQMKGARFFTPNRKMHPEFAEALRRAAESGVRILAYDCLVAPDRMEIQDPVPVCLGDPVPVCLGDSVSVCPEESALGYPEEPVSFGKNLPPLKTTLRIGCLEEVPKPLVKWYHENRRILPWREQPTPYRVWVSEIMLQQTRVEAVKPYFERFMKKLPDIESLAEVSQEELLKLWEGLGYYNRARNLQKAAVQIMETCGGSMPGTYEQLIGLQGIGSYTAGAIASIAFGQPCPAVDGNVLRVVSRVTLDGRIIDDAKVKLSVEKDLEKVIPRDCPGDFNQAMMELGACVCIPNGAPHCGECPLKEVCRAHLEGRETEYPRRAAKKQRKIEEKTILIIRDENRAALCRRGEKGLLAGMYGLPSMEGLHTAEEVVEYLAANGIRTIRIQPAGEAKHIFTHKEWRMTGYMVRVDELADREPSPVTKEWIFVEPEETREKYPIPSAYAAYTAWLRIRPGKPE